MATKKAILITAAALVVSGGALILYASNKKKTAAQTAKAKTPSITDPVIPTAPAPVDPKIAKAEKDRYEMAKNLAWMMQVIEMQGANNQTCFGGAITDARCRLLTTYGQILFSIGYRKDLLKPEPIKI